ncbi:DNA repair protein RadC [Frankia sp. Mgl5]|nr:DNA repair protein RadC [Frankia sp. Mgl5]MCK9925992.1 DNA repair protein RadC [Frankia sp. Mgl5]
MNGVAMRVKDLPIRERPRERALAAGAEALADRELLALLLGSGSPGCDAVDLAGRLIARHGGLYELSRADPQELIAQPGVGPAKAARVCAAFHLGRRARPPAAGATGLTSTAALAEAAAPLLRGLRGERVVVVVCDGNAGILRARLLTQGASGHSPLSMRDLLGYVLRCGGSAFGVAHNHPDGNPEPSVDDRLVTTRLRESAALLGLRFLDHVVITDETWRRVVDT